MFGFLAQPASSGTYRFTVAADVLRRLDRQLDRSGERGCPGADDPGRRLARRRGGTSALTYRRAVARRARPARRRPGARRPQAARAGLSGPVRRRGARRRDRRSPSPRPRDHRPAPAAAPRRSRSARSSKRVHARRIGDDGRRRESLDQRPRDAGVDRRDQPDPQRGQPRRDERHRDPRAAREPERSGHAVEHLAVGEDVRAADLDLAASAYCSVGRLRPGKRSCRRSPIGCVGFFSQAGAIIAGSRWTR